MSRVAFTNLTGSVAVNGTGDASTTINNAIIAAGLAYDASANHQEIRLPAGAIRFTSQINMSRSGVILMSVTDPGPTGPFNTPATKLRFDAAGGNAIRVGRNNFGSYGADKGPYALTANAVRGTNTITVSTSSAASIPVGSILCIDEEDDLTFVRRGDANFEKRQPGADTNGPALRVAGAWRSVASLIKVDSKAAPSGGNVVITLADPLHMNWRVSQIAQVYHCCTPFSLGANFEGIDNVGLEGLYITGGMVTTNNVANYWVKNCEIDGNPGTVNVGTYTNQGGISGRSLNLFHVYRGEVRGCYVHHTRSIVQGGGGYLLSLSSYTSETLVEDNIVVFGNKPLVMNMAGGGNVIAGNYVDNAKTNSAGWQEGGIDLNHQCFTHNALVENNWAVNGVVDTTHGNAGLHVFFRNNFTGKNTAPLWGAYPYAAGSDTQYMRAAGPDGYHRELSYVGNVLAAGTNGLNAPRYEVTDQFVGGGAAAINTPCVYRVGWGVDGGGSNIDDGTARTLLYRHRNYDNITPGVVLDPANLAALPDSMYLASAPAYMSGYTWPAFNPDGSGPTDRIHHLPAKDRFDGVASTASVGTAAGTIKALTGAAAASVSLHGTATGTVKALTGIATSTFGSAVTLHGTASGTIKALTGTATGESSEAQDRFYATIVTFAPSRTTVTVAASGTTVTVAASTTTAETGNEYPSRPPNEVEVPDPDVVFPLRDQPFTIADMDIHVDPFTGDDTAEGTAAFPVQTPEEADRRVPFLIRHNVVVTIHGGTGVTYNTNFIWGRTITGGSLTFQNVDYIEPTGLTGATTGAFTSTSGYRHTDSGGTWATNELRGYFVEFTTGALAGVRRPIDRNTGTIIDAAIVSASVSGASFRIVKPAVTVTPLDPAQYGIRLTGVSPNAASFVVRGFNVQGGTSGIRIYDSATIRNCRTVAQTSFGINGGLARDVSVTESFSEAPVGSNSSRPGSFDGCRQMTLASSVFHGNGDSGVIISARPCPTMIIGGSTTPVFIDDGSSGIICYQGRLSTGRTIIRDIDNHGILATNINGTLTSWEIAANFCVTLDGSSTTDPGGSCYLQLSACTLVPVDVGVYISSKVTGSQVHLRGVTTITGGNYGVRNLSPGTLVRQEDAILSGMARGHSIEFAPGAALHLVGASANTCEVKTCSVYGVSVDGHSATVAVLGHCNIKDNTTAGVSFNAPSGFCNFISHANLVMSGNNGATNDDLRLIPAGAFTTIAALRGDADKTITDANFFNRLHEP